MKRKHYCYDFNLLKKNIFLYLSGGYYTIELAGRRLRLISLNMNIYLEDIADEFSYHERSSLSQGLLRSSRHQQSTSDHRIRHNQENRKMFSDKKTFMGAEHVSASRKRFKSDSDAMKSMQSNPTSSWVSDPTEQWEWLHRQMEEARRKEQNVRAKVNKTFEKS